MKLLIITPNMDVDKFGGMERFVYEFSRELVKQCHSVTILTGKSEAPMAFVNGIRVIREKLFEPKVFNKLFKYLHLSSIANEHIKYNAYDYVLAMGYSGILLRQEYIWRASGSPARIMYNKEKGFFRKLGLIYEQVMEKICIKNARWHLFPSLAMKDYFEVVNKANCKPYFVPCSASPKSFFVKQHNKTLKHILVINGLAEKRKGADVLFWVASHLPKGMQLNITGKVNFKIPQESLKNINILGRINPHYMSNIYNYNDVLLSTSKFEGFPNTLLEARAHGLPIISSDLIGISEYFNTDQIKIYYEWEDIIEHLHELKPQKERIRQANEAMKGLLTYEVFTKGVVEYLVSRANVNMLNGDREWKKEML